MDTDEAIESVRINGVSLLTVLKGILSPVTKKNFKAWFDSSYPNYPHIPDPSKASPVNPTS